MTYRAVTCNAHGPSPKAKNDATIKAASSRADVLCVQEADSEVRAAVRALPGFDYYIAPSNARVLPIAWREDLFDKVDAGWWRIMVNKPGVKDGPDRFMVWVLLRERATGRLVVHVNVHLIHQAFTRAKHRKPQWVASVAALGVRVAQLIARHRAPVVICGDWNRPSKFDIPGVDERELSSPATFGKRSPVLRYDRFFVVGKATLSGAARFDTPSDHHSLQATVTLTGATSQPTPAPEPAPAPTTEAPVTSGYLTDLATAVRKSGLPVVEVADWKRRGHGAFKGVKSIIPHHTAGPASGNMPSLNVVTYGRSGLPGPLCNLGLARDGTVYVVAAGVAYHAGSVGTSAHDNWHAIGIEAEATGTTSWPREQYDAYVRLCRTLCDHYDVPVHMVLGHKEIATPRGRKIDPNFDMAAFRHAVSNATTAPVKDWFDMATEKDLRKIVREEIDAALGDVVTVPPNETASYIDGAGKGQKVQLTSALTRMWRHLIDLKEK